MRVLALTLLVLTACPKKQEPVEPVPPTPDAAIVDADPGPMQTPPEPIRASSYPQDCTRDTDCVAVFEGSPCDACRCAYNAIRTDALAKYKADLGGFWSCHKSDDCKTACHQKIGDAAKCEAGTCVLPP